MKPPFTEMQRRAGGDAETPPIAARVDTSGGLALGERLSVHVDPDPLAIRIERAGRVLFDGLELWAADGEVHDHFVQITEGVIPREERGSAFRVGRGELESTSERSLSLSVRLGDGASGRLALAISRERVVIELTPERPPLRLGARWSAVRGEHVSGLGARHGTAFDQMGRRVHLGADRRYTGPDCPEEMLEQGGIPQGDYAPVPWLLSSAGYALWIETGGPGVEFELDTDPHLGVGARRRGPAAPPPLHRPDAGRPPALLLPADRLPGAAARMGLRPLEEPRRLRARRTTCSTTSRATSATRFRSTRS